MGCQVAKSGTINNNKHLVNSKHSRVGLVPKVTMPTLSMGGTKPQGKEWYPGVICVIEDSDVPVYIPPALRLPRLYC